MSQFAQHKSKFDQAPNTTRFIGGKWKGMVPQSRAIFAIRGTNELEVYSVRKALWALNEDMSAKVKKKNEEIDAMASRRFLLTEKTPYETLRQLAFFLS